MSKWLKCIVAPMLAVSLGAMAATLEEQIDERTKPVGQVCVAGDDCGAAVVAAPATAGEPRSGETVYAAACTTCHEAGVGGSPKLGDVAAWSDRIAQGNDSLYDHAINGLNGMPAKGLCMDCSDDEIKAAVDYIVENSQ